MTATDLNDYFYFVHVVEKGGFSAAANALGMPKSRLSRHINALEERLVGVRIERSTPSMVRSPHPTDSADDPAVQRNRHWRGVLSACTRVDR